MAKITPLYPQFVMMGGSTALRLVRGGKNNYVYYRDGGDWDVDIHRFENGDLITCSHMGSLNGINLRPITEAQWKNCNGKYAPDDFERYGWEFETLSTWGSNPCAEIALLVENNNKYKYLLMR